MFFVFIATGFNRQQFKHENLTLEVRKIPVEFNNIAKLNEHFGKFGTLTNIQVKSDFVLNAKICINDCC